MADMLEAGTQEILRHAVKGAEQTTESAQRSLQIVNQTKEVQAATLESLKSQGEQMRRIHGNIQNVKEGVDEAEMVLDSMVCCGCFGTKAKAKSNVKKTARCGAAGLCTSQSVCTG
ncbi:unnamed protein product [Ostreobium quekettii]|uniref:Uncharacterized protein n=1 Tax=Ostreobium quekettii TaxID=121088 RepID=A0A8S1IR09_9CHLO|nr:unnamed protein product [Ostreobium quekettii]